MNITKIFLSHFIILIYQVKRLTYDEAVVEGRTQEWGKPIQIIKKGDVIWCPPNVKHWHGAGEHSKMSHIAISLNAKENKATWLERNGIETSG